MKRIARYIGGRSFKMKNLKKLREAHGLTQAQLAERLFITQQSVYKYENDLAYPNVETLKMMSGFFHVSIDFLVENELTTTLTQKEKELLTYYQKLSPSVQNALFNLIKSIS